MPIALAALILTNPIVMFGIKVAIGIPIAGTSNIKFKTKVTT